MYSVPKVGQFNGVNAGILQTFQLEPLGPSTLCKYM